MYPKNFAIAIHLCPLFNPEGFRVDAAIDSPPFPPLTWDKYSWSGEIRLPSWGGIPTVRFESVGGRLIHGCASA